jgi:hypothetical protein
MEYRMNAARKLGGKKRVLLLTPGDKPEDQGDEQEAGLSHLDQVSTRALLFYVSTLGT